MDCGDTDLGHSEQGMACGDMTLADCTLAASLGNCSALPSAVVSEQANVPMPAPSRSCIAGRHPGDGYLSIILDTLTPPPNSSKA